MELYFPIKQTNITVGLFMMMKLFSFVYFNPMEIKGVKIGGKFLLYYYIFLTMNIQHNKYEQISTLPNEHIHNLPAI